MSTSFRVSTQNVVFMAFRSFRWNFPCVAQSTFTFSFHILVERALLRHSYSCMESLTYDSQTSRICWKNREPDLRKIREDLNNSFCDKIIDWFKHQNEMVYAVASESSIQQGLGAPSIPSSSRFVQCSSYERNEVGFNVVAPGYYRRKKFLYLDLKDY